MTAPKAAAPMRRSLLVVLPVLTFAILAGIFYVRLRSGADPAAIPSMLIGKPLPSFRLEALPGVTLDGKAVPGMSSDDLKGIPTLLNVWASWCAPCQIEHLLLMRLSRESGVRVVGIAYKDEPEKSRRFLSRNGIPFQAIGVDPTGRTAIDLGVYGVPESFIIGADGTVRYKLVGILTPENYASILAKLHEAGPVAAAAR